MRKTLAGSPSHRFVDNKTLTETCQELGHTDATRTLIVRNKVYDPAVFSPQLFRFTRPQYLFLNAYRVGVPLEEAAAKAEISVDAAERFLKKPSTVAWLDDRALKDHIRNEWSEPGKWWELGNDVLEGRKQFTKAQIVVFQEFGTRVCPKTRELDGSQKGTTINFNFSPDAVKEAFRRQESIEGELVKEQANA